MSQEHPDSAEMTDEELWDKAVGQLRLTLNEVLRPLRLYGQNHYVDSATEEIISLAIQLHYRLEGVEEPYHVNHEKLHW